MKRIIAAALIMTILMTACNTDAVPGKTETGIVSETAALPVLSEVTALSDKDLHIKYEQAMKSPYFISPMLKEAVKSADAGDEIKVFLTAPGYYDYLNAFKADGTVYGELMYYYSYGFWKDEMGFLYETPEAVEYMKETEEKLAEIQKQAYQSFYEKTVSELGIDKAEPVSEDYPDLSLYSGGGFIAELTPDIIIEMAADKKCVMNLYWTDDEGNLNIHPNDYIFFNEDDNTAINLKTAQKPESSVYEVTPPFFNGLSEAADVLKTRPVGTETWHIYYADENYIIMTYNSGAEYLFRFNVIENRIDRALNVNPDKTKDWNSWCRFFPDGEEFYIFAGEHWFGKIEEQAEYSQFSVNFDKETIYYIGSFVHGSEKVPDFGDTELYNGYEISIADAKKYREAAEKDGRLPVIPSDWCNVIEISSGKFVIVMPSDENNTLPGYGYFYYKIVTVDINNPDDIQTFEIQDLGKQTQITH